MTDYIAEAPSSCRSCAFLVKCFGQPNSAPPVKPSVTRDGWIVYQAPVAGITTRVVHNGSKGMPVVFIHGPAGSADRWVYNLYAIGRSDYAGYALDLPGHGFADAPTNFEPSAETYAGFIGAFLESLDEPAVLVGASLGGHAAMLAAAQKTGLVRGIVLVAGTGLATVEPDACERLQRQIIYRSREGGLERFRRAFYDTRGIVSEMVEQEFRMNMSTGRPEAMRALACYVGQASNDDMVDGPALESLHEIPTLLVWGAEDRIIAPSHGEKSLARLGRASRLVTIADAGHMPNLERPGEFNRILLDFLAQPTTDRHGSSIEAAA